MWPAYDKSMTQIVSCKSNFPNACNCLIWYEKCHRIFKLVQQLCPINWPWDFGRLKSPFKHHFGWGLLQSCSKFSLSRLINLCTLWGPASIIQHSTLWQWNQPEGARLLFGESLWQISLMRENTSCMIYSDAVWLWSSSTHLIERKKKSLTF